MPVTRELVIGNTGRLRRSTLQGKELHERCIGSARAFAVSSREASRRQATGVRSLPASKTGGDIRSTSESESDAKDARKGDQSVGRKPEGARRKRRSSNGVDGGPAAHPIQRMRRLEFPSPSFEEVDVRSAAHDPDPTLIL